MRSVVWVLILTANSALAGAQVRQMSLEDLAQGAERIVVGGVQKVESRWQGSMIVTDVTLVPTEVLKGAAATAPIVFTIPGGTMGGQTMKAGEAPTFVAQEMAVVFLKMNGTPCHVYGWFRGKSTIVGDRIRELPDTTYAQYRTQILSALNH